mgnify:CR=1 FL=1
MINTLQTISPNLWFQSEALEAVEFYTSIFNNASIKHIAYYSNSTNDQSEKKVMSIAFQLEGQDFLALNGRGPESFTSAISFVVNCKNQDEIDYYWGKLTEGADETHQVCGWLKDRFGVFWQVIPENLSHMMSDPDPKK